MFNHLKFFIFIVVQISFSVCFAVEITFSGLPDDYSVYQWIPSENAPVQSDRYQSDRFERLTINIPDEHVQRTDEGNIDLLSSLEAWRQGTPRGPGYPFTSASGVARFPFYITSESYSSDQSIPPTGRLTQYISLRHLTARAGEMENLRYHAHNGETVTVVQRGLVDELRQIRASGGPVNCNKATGLGSRGPWTSAECYLCNCANEAGIENHRGKVEVNRVVLRRVVSSYFPNSICDTVLFKAQGSNGRIQAAFSWTYGNNRYQVHDRIPDSSHGSGQILNQCVDAGIEALNLGPGNFDHYYNPAAANPGWASRATHRQRIGRHIFLNKLPLNQRHAADLEEEVRGTGGDIIRPIENFSEQPEEVNVDR